MKKEIFFVILILLVLVLPVFAKDLSHSTINKNFDMYSEKNVFIITDKDWKDVLGLVPVTTWTQVGDIKKYPTLVLHDESGTEILRNYAYLADVEVSSEVEDQIADYIVDERIDTRWNSGSSGDGWVVIDLGEIREIDEIRMHQTCDLYDYDVLYSLDGETYDGLVSGRFDFGWNQEVFDLVNVRYLKFLITDHDPETPNWKCLGDTFVYNNEDRITVNGFDADSIIHFLQMYEPDMITLVGNTPLEFDNLLISEEPFGAGLSSYEIERIYPEDYLNYWSEYNYVVYVEDDYEKALMASTYASLIDAPLVVENSIYDFPGVGSGVIITGRIAIDIPSTKPGNVEPHIPPTVFDNKRVVLVGNVDCPDTARNCESFGFEELQKEYIDVTNTDKLLMVNPRDINGVGMETIYWTDKAGSPIVDVFGKNSLVAPFLAAGKHELLIFDDIPISPMNPDCNGVPLITANAEATNVFVEEIMLEFFDNDAEYLTIVASPKAIPDSVFTGCLPYNNQLRIPVDKIYSTSLSTIATISPSGWRFLDYNLYEGRIYGISSSDVSSYVARSLFYTDLMDNIYDSNYYSIFSIGTECHGDDPAYLAKLIKDYYSNLGYGAECSSHIQGVGCDRESENPSDWFSDEEINMFLNKQIISFDDHGFVSAWAEVFETSQIPSLQLPIVITAACSTGNFWEGGAIEPGLYTMSHNFLRKGSVGYYGAVGLAWGNEMNHYDKYIQALSLPNNYQSIGKITKLFDTKTFNYNFLGDPTLEFKNVADQENSMFNECNDGIDNDGDGFIDFYEELTCSHPFDLNETLNETLEESFVECNDGIDNDGDGDIDYPGDSGCISISGNNEGPECDDGIDNDGDGDIDWEEDFSCSDTSWRDNEGPECDDGIDNDGDGDIDWEEDSDCFSPFDTAEHPPECDDGIDNDGDGFIDYPADLDCIAPAWRSENPECYDDIDNDGDGFVDYPDDTGCHNSSSWIENPDCDDGIDNDGDGFVDYPADLDCINPFDTAEHPPECDDGIDNDGDGFIDMQDIYCILFVNIEDWP